MGIFQIIVSLISLAPEAIQLIQDVIKAVQQHGVAPVAAHMAKFQPVAGDSGVASGPPDLKN